MHSTKKFCENIFDEQTNCKSFFLIFVLILSSSLKSHHSFLLLICQRGRKRKLCRSANIFYDQSPEVLVCNFHVTKMPMFIFSLNWKNKNNFQHHPFLINSCVHCIWNFLVQLFSLFVSFIWLKRNYKSYLAFLFPLFSSPLSCSNKTISIIKCKSYLSEFSWWLVYWLFLRKDWIKVSGVHLLCDFMFLAKLYFSII